MTTINIASRERNSASLNKLDISDRAAHGWYRFVLSYPPHLVRQYLEQFGADNGSLVLDPFCGTGTTIVECKKLGVPSIGIEANKVAHFASAVKVDWMPDPDVLLEHSTYVAQAALNMLKAEGIVDGPIFSVPQNGHCTQERLRALPLGTHNLLLTDSISPLPLHKTLILLECLEKYCDGQVIGHQQLALAKALIGPVGNLHFGPEVGVGPAKADAPVIALWLENIRSMANELRQLHEGGDVSAVVHHADSRQVAQVIEPHSIDVVITSPPYPNEKDYTRTTRLESVLLGFVHSKEDLRSLKRTLIRSNTRGVYKEDEDDQFAANYPEIQAIAEAIEARRIELGKTSGFERLYARVTKLYFGGMARHLADLRAVLRPGAQLAYVVGDQASYLRVMIRTGHLLAGIAQSLGYEVLSIDLFRTRLATATKEQLREEVLVLRWPGERTNGNG